MLLLFFFKAASFRNIVPDFFAPEFMGSNPKSIWIAPWWNDLSVTLVTCFPLKILLWGVVFYCQNATHCNTLLHHFVAFFFLLCWCQGMIKDATFADVIEIEELQESRFRTTVEAVEVCVEHKSFCMTQAKAKNIYIYTSEYEYVFSIVWYTFVHTTSHDNMLWRTRYCAYIFTNLNMNDVYMNVWMWLFSRYTSLRLHMYLYEPFTLKRVTSGVFHSNECDDIWYHLRIGGGL